MTTVLYRTIETRVPRQLHRPAGITDRTRWLFAGLVLISLALALPGCVISRPGAVVALALASSAVLATSWVYTYATGRLPLGLDVIAAVAITGFALTCPEQPTVFPVAFAAIWFCALYGSAWRSLLRCGLYLAGIGASFPLAPTIPGQVSTPNPALLALAGPMMVLTVVVGRHLATGLQAREQSLERDAALAVLGSQLLAVTDAVAIRTLASHAVAQLCSATPGLRLLLAVRDGMTFRIEAAAGPFAAVPSRLPIAATPSDPQSPESPDTAILNSAAGAALDWATVPIDNAAWMLLGTPVRLPTSTLLTVRSLLIMVSLALRNSQIHHELTTQASFDSLTGLVNRSAFSTALTAALAHAADPARLHLLFVDLDDFKDVNDRLGHLAGDQVLAEVANRLRRCTRINDICSRLGGDEFAVILADTSAAEATDIAERIVRELSEPIPLNVGVARVGASVGITSARSEPTTNPGPLSATATANEIHHHADIAMYVAKANGKGQIQWFDDSFLQPTVSY